MFLVLPVFAAARDGVERPLFESHDVLEVTIEAPLTTLMKDRPDEEYLDGIFSYVDADGAKRTFDLKLRTRGKFRRQRANCSFAPIRLNFRTEDLEGSDLAGENRLKLVTHCQSRTRYEQLVLREFLTYRIMNALSDLSFRARLMRINYVDTEKAKPVTRYGFVIEDEDHLGERIGMQKIQSDGLSYSVLEPVHTSLVTAFQYLIGNTDYSLVRGPENDDCCHNAVPFSDAGTLYSIPYDFDHSGMVNAPYAAPNPQFKIRSVRTRVYRGRCSHNEILPDTLEDIAAKRGEVMSIVDSLVDLDERNRREVTRYLDAFFEEIAKPAQVERRLVGKCS